MLSDVGDVEDGDVYGDTPADGRDDDRSDEARCFKDERELVPTTYLPPGTFSTPRQDNDASRERGTRRACGHPTAFTWRIITLELFFLFVDNM